MTRPLLKRLHPCLSCIIVLDVEGPSKPETWTFQLMSSWPRDATDDGQTRFSNDALLAKVKPKTSIFADPINSANEWVPEGTHVHTNRVSYWQPIPWDNRKGSVTLAGDAAHPMTFRKPDQFHTPQWSIKLITSGMQYRSRSRFESRSCGRCPLRRRTGSSKDWR